jgi:hypothetical protein
VKRECAQALQPRRCLAAVDDRARECNAARDGLRAARDHQGQSALQYQRVEMRTLIAAFEHVDQRLEICLRVAALELAGRAARNTELLGIDVTARDLSARDIERQE